MNRLRNMSVTFEADPSKRKKLISKKLYFINRYNLLRIIELVSLKTYLLNELET